MKYKTSSIALAAATAIFSLTTGCNPTGQPPPPPPPPSLTVSPDKASISVGSTQQFHATFSDPGSGAADKDVTASVTWTSSDTGIASIVTGGTNAGLATSLKGGGPVTITAKDTSHNLSGTAKLTVTGLSSTTTTITSVSSNLLVTGQTFTVNFNVVAPNLGGSATPMGLVTVNASTGGLFCSVQLPATNCSGHVSQAGSFVLTAAYSGDANFAPSTSVPFPFTVNPASTTTTITAVSANPAVTGQLITVNYTVSVNSPGVGPADGVVTVKDNLGNTICSSAFPACSGTAFSTATTALTATFTSYDFLTSTSAPFPFTVNKASTTITITSVLGSVTGHIVTVQWALKVTFPGFGTPTAPTGMLFLEDNLGNTMCAGPPGGTLGGDTFNGGCFGTVTSAAISASVRYFGDSNFLGSVSPPVVISHALTVNSINPASGVQMTVSPTDDTGQGDGATPFTRTFTIGTAAVTLTAPATAAGVAFSGWIGCDSTSGTPPVTCSVTMNTDRTVTAHYGFGGPCTLDGQYAFLFQGWDSPTDPAHGVAIAGSFTVNSSGIVLPGGVEDINRFSGVSTNVTITGGSCTVGTSPNRGVLTLTTNSFGTTRYHFTVDSTNSKGEFIEFDDTDGTGTRGSGFFEKQDTTAFSAGLVASLDGDKAFGLSGNLSNGRRAAAVGRFTLGSGTINKGEADVSRGSSSGGESTGQLGLTGSFTAPDTTTGRGTATLMFSFTAIVPETYTFSYYIISTAKIVLLQTDNRNATFTTTFSGLMRRQTPPLFAGCTPDGTFCNTSLNGRMVFALQGAQTGTTIGSQPTGNPSVAVGLLGADGGGHLTTSIFDQNDGGTIKNSSFSGDYAVAADGLGRTTLTLSFTNPPPFPPTLQVAYLTGVNEGFIMDAPPLSGSLTEAEVNFGEFKGQVTPPGGFTPGSLSGAFRVNSEPPPAPGVMFGNVQNESGLGALDGVGTTGTGFDLSVDISDVLNFLHSDVLLGTYSVSGIGRVTITSLPNFACWIIAPTGVTSTPAEFACISTTASDASTPLLRFRQ